jgi:hypothetical protein
MRGASADYADYTDLDHSVEELHVVLSSVLNLCCLRNLRIFLDVDIYPPTKSRVVTRDAQQIVEKTDRNLKEVVIHFV